LPQVKARYVFEMVELICDSIDRLCSGDIDEGTERLITKVIDRVATNAEMPPTAVALEVERARRTRLA
jgi:hypothetical protein